MELDPKFLPFEVNLFDSDICYEEAFCIEAERIENVSKFVSICVQICMSEDLKWEQQQSSDYVVKTSMVSNPKYKNKINKLYQVWLEHLIENFVSLMEIRDYEMKDELDPITFKPRRFKHCVGMQIFTELTRLFYLKERPLLLYPDEEVCLSNMKDVSWVKIIRSFDITDQYEEKEDKDDDVETRLAQLKEMWEKPILQYNQSEILTIILFLVQQLNEVKEECLEEYKLVFETVWIRVSHFLMYTYTEDVLNDSEMNCIAVPEKKHYTVHRNFYMFITIYMVPILRRFFYRDMFLNLVPTGGTLPGAPAGAPAVKKWVESIINGFAEEAFNDMYLEHCAEAYIFPGDVMWFKYMFPTAIASVAAYLARMRPHLYRRYFSEGQASKKAVLAAVDESYIARSFVLKAISAYIQIKTGINEVKFYDACAIQSMELNISYYTMTSNRCPLIVQAFSTYWAYDDKCFYPSDNVYETVGRWFYLLKTRYESKLHGFLMKRFIKEIEPPPPAPEVRGEEEEEALGLEPMDIENNNIFVNESETVSKFLV